MKITMPVTLTASDVESRIIAGRIVQWDAVGNTSAGQTKFLENSIKLGKNTKLVLEHQITKPIGKLVEWSQDATGITASFKIAKTPAGNDALEEAATGLRSDFSVGVQVDSWANDEGVMAISDSQLVEVSLVTSGAIPGSIVEKVAATNTPQISEETQEITTQSIEGEQVSDTTVPEASAAETVEAAKVEVKAATAPFIQTTVRHPITSPATFLEHSVRATLGDSTSALYVAAASDGTLLTELAGLNHTPQLSTVWNPKTTNVRPAISAIRTATIPTGTGLKFQIPRVKTAPTVAVAAEKGAFSDTQIEIEYVDVTQKKFAGMQKFDVEVLDLSTPAFFEEMVRLMADQYAAATDAEVVTAIKAGTLDSTSITLPFDGDEFSGFISRGAASIYNATKRFPTGVVMSPDQWANIIALNDSNKRPLFNVAGSPQNSLGDMEPGSPVGSVLGLPVYVDPNMSGVADDSICIVNRDSFVWYEGAGPLQLRSNIVSTGQVEVGYYGYGAVATLTAAGSFTFNAA